MTLALDELLAGVESESAVEASPRDAVRAFERSAAVERKSLPDRITSRQLEAVGGVDEGDRVPLRRVRAAIKSVHLGREEPTAQALQQRRFPSSLLASYVRTGCIEWLVSYATLHGLSAEELIAGMPSEEQLKLDITQGVRAAISAIASIAKQSGVTEYVVGKRSKFEPAFSELLNRYLPMMSLHIFQAIEKPLFSELSLKAQEQEFFVSSAHLMAQDQALIVRVRAWEPKKLGPPPGEEASRAVPV